MGAVVVLGMVYVVLASAAIQGLRAEGDAERRLRAAALADLEVARVEQELALGVAPVLGRVSRSEDGFEVEITSAPFELPPELAEDPDGAPRDPTAPTLFPGPRGREPGPVRVVEVRVRWDDGSGPQETVRTTWAVDAAAAQQVLETAGLGPPAVPGAGPPTGEEGTR